MVKKKMVGFLAHICARTILAGAALAAEPAISVTAKQRYPWNGLVDVDFTVAGDSGSKYKVAFAAKDEVGGTNLTMKTLTKSNGAAADASGEQLLPGNYHWTRNAAVDLP